MAIQRDHYYEAGDMTITGAYHKISQIEFRYECGARPSGDQGGGPDPAEADSRIQYDVFANSGVRYSIATPLDGRNTKWPLENWTGVVDKDSLLQSAYGFLKTGELVSGTDV